MRSESENKRYVRNAFNEYIDSVDFNGVVTPGDFYAFCAKTARSDIDQSLLNRLTFSVGDLASEVDLTFARNAPNPNTRLIREKLLKEALYIIRTKSIPENTSIKHLFKNKNDGKELFRYVYRDALFQLVNKTINLGSIPAWSRNKGRDLLNDFAFSPYNDFDLFLAELKKSNGYLKLKSVNTIKQGIVYAKETEYKSKKEGYVVVKLGRSEKSDLSRAFSAKDRREGRECRIFGTKNIVSAENEALQSVSNDPLCIAFNLPNNKTRGRNQEYFEIPSSHFNIFANYVKTAAGSYL